MSLKRKIKNTLKYIFFPFVKVDKLPIGAVLMLHRIEKIDKEKLWYNEHLKISPEYLENLIIKFKKKGFKFVSLDKLRDVIVNKKKAKKLIAITLDDGYRDNFENGLAILKKHNVPFCIYVATGMVGKQFIYWWYIIEDLILANDEIILNDGKKFDCSTKDKKEQAFLNIREIILKLPQTALAQGLPELLSNYKIDINAYNETLPLTWDQIKALNEEPLATIGCHTHSHLAFTGCSEQEIKDDIQLSRKLMKENANIKLAHFCFPFGDKAAISDEHVKLLKQLDFKTSATTADGICQYKTDIMELPRIFVTEKNGEDVLNRIYTGI
ncbi:MAG: polysaccharide deacetylase family protein [Candidatus Gastranaerophilaceae bacterium]